jgi:L-lactate dehydrogenase complex protein LldG
MTTTRDEILARVRDALGPTGTASYDPAYRRVGARPAEALADLFAERVSDYRATVHRAPPEGVSATVDSTCLQHGVRRLGVPADLPTPWRPRDVEVVVDDALDVTALDRLEGVLTGCELAIAETGTIVLAGGYRSGRRALTLVPDLYICVVEADQIVELVPEAIARLGPLVRRTRRPLTLVSGPSATSDIELDRVEGVHGPRTLEVVIVESRRSRPGESDAGAS